MKHTIRTVLDNTPYISRLRAHSRRQAACIQDLQDENRKLKQLFSARQEDLEERLGKEISAATSRNESQVEALKREAEVLRNDLPAQTKLVKQLRNELSRQGKFRCGHYYSPVPDVDEIRTFIERRPEMSRELPGVDMNADHQFTLLQEFATYYADLPFPETESKDCRYYFQNDWFSYADAIFLYSMLRKFQPKKVIEIGSGFSSAVTLDSVERVHEEQPQLVFIEPNPERLNKLLRVSDRQKATVIQQKIQDVPLHHFCDLQAGDLLFVDSSHVVKCGSDLHWIFFEILPRIAPGVIVHFHDVFYPFDYPDQWLLEGRYWNENYMLRAFLSYNSEWDIEFFNTYVGYAFEDYIKENLPKAALNQGGGLYLRRKAA